MLEQSVKYSNNGNGAYDGQGMMEQSVKYNSNGNGSYDGQGMMDQSVKYSNNGNSSYDVQGLLDQSVKYNEPAISQPFHREHSIARKYSNTFQQSPTHYFSPFSRLFNSHNWFFLNFYSNQKILLFCWIGLRHSKANLRIACSHHFWEVSLSPRWFPRRLAPSLRNHFRACEISVTTITSRLMVTNTPRCRSHPPGLFFNQKYLKDIYQIIFINHSYRHNLFIYYYYCSYNYLLKATNKYCKVLLLHANIFKGIYLLF